MNPILLFIITYAPLCAVAFMQMSGAGPILEIIKTKQTGNICPIPFIAMIACSILNICYGYLLNDQIVFVASCSGVLCGFFYLGSYLICTTAQLRMHYLKILVSTFILLMIFIGAPLVFEVEDHKYDTNYIGLGSCVLVVFLMGSPLSAMKTVLKDKNTKSMSFIISLSMTVNGVLWLIYGIVIMHGNLIFVIPNALGAIAGFIQLALFCIYPSSSETSETDIVYE